MVEGLHHRQPTADRAARSRSSSTCSLPVVLRAARARTVAPYAAAITGGWVGDDWAEDHHDVEVQDETGRRLSNMCPRRAALQDGHSATALKPGPRSPSEVARVDAHIE